MPFVRSCLKNKEKFKMAFQTEFNFTLPRGYIDKDGNVHKEGTMRLVLCRQLTQGLLKVFLQWIWRIFRTYIKG